LGDMRAATVDKKSVAENKSIVEKIPLSRAYHSEQIDRRILEVVKGGNFILGPECKAFEAELAAHTGVPKVVLSSSWTAAVHLLHIAQQFKSGDEILVPSLTAFPTIEPMVHAGAKPVFCDIDDTYTIDPADIRRKISPRTVGIIPVHLYGHPANLDAIQAIASEHKLWILEDCAQAQGARWRGQRVGSIGEFAAFSFYPSKNLTVYGDGGALATRNADIAARVAMLRNHGRKDKYLHEKIGFNLRFNEINAAVGREQLKVLDDLNGRRRHVAALYRRELSGFDGLSLPPDDVAGQSESVYHLFVIRLKDHDTRDQLARHLHDANIETGVHYPVPNHRQPAITDRFGPQPELPKTEDYTRRILSLPMYPDLSDAQAQTVAAEVRNFLAR
jgi:dTDP-4-amino-4,6-dideoxygalactose transaminase